MTDAFSFTPPAASTLAGKVDALYFWLVSASTLVTLGVALTILVFCIRYRASAGAKAQDTKPRLSLELAWTAIPLVIFLGFFFVGAELFVEAQTHPKNALHIYAIGKQWMWKFQHPNGRREINTLHVPVGQPVVVTLASEDVIHSMYVPAFRVKQDVLPGRYTTLWFEATQPGEFFLFCAEYCGTSHSHMRGSIIALSQAGFDAWLGESIEQKPAQDEGQVLFHSLGCPTCHDTALGPSLNGLFGHVVRLNNGKTVTADAAYIRESIENPTAKIVEGYSPIMPSFAERLSEDQLQQLVQYITKLADSPRPQNPSDIAP